MSDLRKGISILGSTGSIGTTALDLIARFRERFRVVALAAGRRVDDLKRQIEEFAPELVSVADPRDAAELALALGPNAPRVVSGGEGLICGGDSAGRRCGARGSRRCRRSHAHARGHRQRA